MREAAAALKGKVHRAGYRRRACYVAQVGVHDAGGELARLQERAAGQSENGEQYESLHAMA